MLPPRSDHNRKRRRQRGKVLFIVADQLRGDCVHGALAAHVAMPNLRRLMGDAVTFTNHFSLETTVNKLIIDLQEDKH